MYGPIINVSVCHPIPHFKVIKAGSLVDGPELLESTLMDVSPKSVLGGLVGSVRLLTAETPEEAYCKTDEGISITPLVEHFPEYSLGIWYF